MLFVSHKLLSSREANLRNQKYHIYIPKLKKITNDYEEESVVTSPTTQIDNIFMLGSHRSLKFNCNPPVVPWF